MIHFDDNLLEYEDEEGEDGPASKKDEINIGSNQPPPPLADAVAPETGTQEQKPVDGSKMRRSTLLGNLTTGGRLSRGYSIGHLLRHLTRVQRQQQDDTFALPPDDYYLIEENDAVGILLEKPEQLPGFTLDQSMNKIIMTTVDKEKKSYEGRESGGEASAVTDTTAVTEEPEIPPDYVFPVQRNVIEQHTRLAITRNLRTYQQKSAIRNEGKCYYGEDEVDLSFLTVKPITFLILGKPGIGKTTLALKLAEKMHAIHLNPENIIEYFRGPKEPLASCRVNEKLEDGDSISDGVVIELLMKRIREFDVLHRGYVLEGFPMITSDDQPIGQQLGILNKLTLNPDYLIIMQMQNKDLYKRRISQKMDPDTGKVYTKLQYSKFDPDELVLNRRLQRHSNVEQIIEQQRRQMTGTHDKNVDSGDTSEQNPVTEEASDTEKRTVTGMEAKMQNSRGSTPEHGELLINEVDFPKLPPEVLDRLICRTEDFNIIISDDLESFRYNFQDLQDFLNDFNKAKVLEVDAYWAPTIIFKRVWEFCEAIGLQPVPIPVQIMRPLSMLYYKKHMSGEDGGESDVSDDDDDEEEEEDDKEASEEICEEDEPRAEIDWVSAMRAVCVRGLVDPRFRWRISRWQNLCPVALKLGRSLPGLPELSVSFMDKVFFMSTKHAADQFINNPRPYLLPKMPTSPVKFIIIGHPLAGKTTFSKELAQLTDAVVIDISKEVLRRFPAVKRDFIWKKKLKYALEATHIVNTENMMRWQRQERTRRRDMHAWVENHLKALAEAEIEDALERDKEMLHHLRIQWRKQVEDYAMGDTFTGDGLCQPDDAKMQFNWRKFVSEAFGGKLDWTHQELLQLAWDLFHHRRLYYKRNKKNAVNLTLVNDFSSSDSEDGLASPDGGRSSEQSEYESYDGEESYLDDMSEMGETDDSSSRNKKKRKKHKKKKKKCIRLEVKPIEPEDVLEPFLFGSFDPDPDDPEVEESVRMRFPMIPFELVDILPAPPLVGDLDPAVQRIVVEKLTKDNIEMDTMPTEIFVEIMKRACAEVEVQNRSRNRHGAMTGGWIIDNFPLEIDKWRAVLRTPQVCPDQVFLMLDLTEGNMTIWSRFKKLYKMLHPPTPIKEVEAPSKIIDNKANSARNSQPSSYRSPRELPGESLMDQPTTEILLKPRNLSKPNMTGEDNQVDEELNEIERRQSRKSKLSGGADLFVSPDFYTEQESNEQEQKEVDQKSLELVSRSHFMLSLLPKDDLTEVLIMSPSEKALIERDLHRNQTMVFSELESDENFLEKAMQGHEKYILDDVNKEFSESDEDEDYDEETWSSVDPYEIQKRKEAEAKFKIIYGEMTVCLDEGDEFNHQRVSSDDIVTTALAENKIKKPPGTPETEDAENSGDEDAAKHNWVVPMPSIIAKGEIEMTPEEYELKTVLENEIRRLSQSQTDDYIKTPTEMGSATTIGRPETASAVEGGYSGGNGWNPLYQKLLTTKIESPKRKFFAQVRIFNEFWNMALPVCNQQVVRSWEVGLCDEETALEKAIFIWNELENRFDAKAKKILETELKEEDEEVLESLVKWGQSFEPGDIRYRQTKDKGDDEEEEPESGSQDDSEVEDESNYAASDSASTALQETDELSALENKPDLYWKAQRRRETERFFGDLKFYCPVTLADLKLLRKGSPKYACKFKDRLYYCVDENSQLRFLTNPTNFISSAGPPTPPPPRICITGSPGCLQEEIAQELCTEYKVAYVNFRQRLHEIIYARIEQEVGPQNTCRIVSKEDTDHALNESTPQDDLLYYVPPEGEHPGEDDEEFNSSVKFSSHSIPVEEIPVVATTVKERALGLINIPSQEILGAKKQLGIHESTLKSLGLVDRHKVGTIPLNSFERTERLTDRKWGKLTRLETYIKAFLENGIQLPDDVLDYFILPMWREAPFTRVGFILVGFPNTYEDVQYMLRKNLIPEHVFVMECKSVVIRNRLIKPAVDSWHRQQNPSGKKLRKLSMRTQRAKMRLEQAARGGDRNEIFPYQLEGRPEIDEFESETWTYKDAVARDIARALRYYHSIYSSGLEKMKKALNKERIEWTPVDTNIRLHQGKHQVLDTARPILRYRNNVFEDSVRLSMTAANVLLDRGVFTLSQLQTWCPVEISKGNTGINLWNAPGVKKIPYLYRRFIYFLAGEKNAKTFEENTLELANQFLTTQAPPLVCMVLGQPKSGKTTLAKRIAERLGLLYVSCQDAIESVITHDFATEWSHILHEVNPVLASSGHQPMTLAKEIMEYIREGRAIPRFLVYRCIDQYLMSPKAQCGGVVFDDYPSLSDELIEVNYREMTPCIVLKMKIPIAEAYERCDRNRNPELKEDDVPEEGRECLDYLWDQHGNSSKETLHWFAAEYQNVHLIDGMPSPEMIYKRAEEICTRNQRKIQEYLKNSLEEKPNTLEGTCPITSTLFHRLTPDFGFFCPVALNDMDELISIKQISDLSQVVEYKGQIFLFSSKNAVRKFLANPKKYTVPGCLRKPPKDLPQTLSVVPEDFERLHEHWGFLDFDPVLYYANHHYKGLQRGDPKYCVVYRNKLYVFINEENQKRFLTKPSQYWNLLLPMKLPRKAEAINYDKVTPYSYLSSKGMIPVLRRLLKLMAEKRPRGPFMSVDQCAALYMGYYLKSQNMNSHFTVRQKYRDAMFKMSTLKRNTQDFLTELSKYYGCRPRNLPDGLRKQLEEFVLFEHMPTEEKVVMPKIPDITLGYDAVEPPFDEPQVARKVRRMMGALSEVEVKEHLTAFKTFSDKKKAAEDAAARAAQDAKDAAELAKKMEQRAQMRMTKARSRGRGSSSSDKRTRQSTL